MDHGSFRTTNASTVNLTISITTVTTATTVPDTAIVHNVISDSTTALVSHRSPPCAHKMSIRFDSTRRTKMERNELVMLYNANVSNVSNANE